MRIGALEAGGTKMVCAVGTEAGEIYDKISVPTQDPRTPERPCLYWSSISESIMSKPWA